MIDVQLVIDGLLAVAMCINFLEIRRNTRKIEEQRKYVAGLVAAKLLEEYEEQEK